MSDTHKIRDDESHSYTECGEYGPAMDSTTTNLDDTECRECLWAVADRATREAAELKADFDSEKSLANDLIAERDSVQEWADKLAAAIAPFEVRGEHSSSNNPWANALDYAEQL